MTDPAPMMNRRDVLTMALAAGAASAFPQQTAQSDEEPPADFPIIDTNVSLFQWPFRRLPLDDSDALVKKLRSLGVTQAWAGSFEGLLQRDLAGVNSRLVEACRSHEELIPIGSINLDLPDWEEDLRRCVDDHNMPGVRVHPNYHGYVLDDARFAELLKYATESTRFVQIAAAMEDTRTQHPMLRAPDVDLAPLPDVTADIPGVRVQILNARLRGPLLERLAAAPGVYFDTARVEGTDGVPQLVERTGPGRVMFGTHAPFLIPEAALIRVHESGHLDAAGLRAVYSENARTFAGGHV